LYNYDKFYVRNYWLNKNNPADKLK
jgi:hypothetical protein